MLPISPNWPQERKILRMRVLLALLFVGAQLFGVFRIDWLAFAVLVLGGSSFVGFIRLGILRRWAILPSVNFLLDQLLSVYLLSVSGGAASPYVFLVYLHVASAIVFLRGQMAVIVVGVVQVAVLILSGLFRLWAGGDAYWNLVFIHSLGVLITASSLAESASSLYRDAATDELTGLLNRRTGLRELSRLVARGQPFGVFFADMKHFKAVNDRFGHAVGDEVLKRVAQRLLSSVRTGDCVVRYGGDEFLVTTRGEPQQVVERLRDALGQPLTTSAGVLKVAVDIGVARFPDDAQTPDDLIRFADEHMFAAKKDG